MHSFEIGDFVVFNERQFNKAITHGKDVPVLLEIVGLQDKDDGYIAQIVDQSLWKKHRQDGYLSGYNPQDGTFLVVGRYLTLVERPEYPDFYEELSKMY